MEDNTNLQPMQPLEAEEDTTIVDKVTIAAKGAEVVTLEETTMPSMLPRLGDKAAASPAVRFVTSPIKLP